MITLPRKVQPEDIEDILHWYDLRGQPLVNATFPPMGLIVEGVCACFLYQTDGDIAMIEGLISNPQAPGFQRYASANDIIKRLKNYAIARGYTKVIGITQDAGTLKRVQRLGFRDLGTYHMVVFGV
jgi:hypothetical protein